MSWICRLFGHETMEKTRSVFTDHESRIIEVRCPRCKSEFVRVYHNDDTKTTTVRKTPTLEFISNYLYEAKKRKRK